MQSRRLATLGVSLFAALSFGVTACNVAAPGTTPGSATPSPVTTTDAKETLAKAVQELGKSSYKVNFTAGPGTGTGAMDPAAQQGQMSLSVFAGTTTLKVESLLVGNDMWIKLGGVPAVPDKWLHIDTSRLPEDNSLGVRPGRLDPAGADKLIEAVTTVEQTGTGQFKGTLDLTKVDRSALLDSSTLKGLGDRAKAVPFEASVDTQGRLTNLKLDLGQVEGVTMKIDVTYSDFGTPVTVAKPAAADSMEAPDAVYSLLGA